MATHETHVVLGSGPLGLSVVDELRRRGHTVRVVTRSGRSPEPGIECQAADVTNPDEVRRVTQDAAVVYHSAQPPYHQWAAGFPPITRGVIEGLRGSGIPLVVGDNVYMYGETAGPIHERLPYGAKTKKGRVRAEVAAAYLDAHREGTIQAVIGRGSDFFGPRVKGSLVGEIVFGSAVASKKAQLVGNIDEPHSMTYIGDFGRALVDLGSRREAFGRAWHVPNAPVTSTREFVQRVYEAAGKPLAFTVAPKLLIQALGLFLASLREIPEMWYQYDRPFVVDSSDFEQTFGWTATPFDESIAATVAWYEEQLVRNKES